jgi:hypothetical protein
MEGPEVGIREAIERVQALRNLVDADGVTVHWTTEFADVTLVADEDGHTLFVGDEPVPERRP